MIVDRYDPIILFELVPKLKLQMEPELARLDVLLDDDELFSLVRADLLKRHPNSGRLGCHSTPVEMILRMLLVNRLYGWSHEQTERFVCDSIVLRQFCRLYLESAPDDTTLIRLANLIGAPTLAALNDRAVQLACSLKVTRGHKLRTDATVVETNIHHPTDDALIADGVRLISRLVDRAKEFIPESVCQAASAEPFRNRTRSAKSLAHKISKMALRRTQEAKASYRAAYQRLVEVARSSIKQAEQVRSMLDLQMPSAAKISEEISHFAGLLKRAVWQTHRRVFEGEQVSAGQKLLSIFEEHTAIIRRGKARKKPSLGEKCGSLRWMGASSAGFRSWRAMRAMKLSSDRHWRTICACSAKRQSW